MISMKTTWKLTIILVSYNRIYLIGCLRYNFTSFLEKTIEEKFNICTQSLFIIHLLTTFHLY